MRDFTGRFGAGIGLLAAGVAGFVALYTGAEVSTAALRGLTTGIVFYVVGRLAGATLYDPPIPAPKPPIPPKKPSSKGEGKT
jgi:hypothetical protein